MSHKKEHHEEHVDETWLIPWSDMLVLLLALFIVMFAMGKTDEEKFEQMKQDFHVIFAGGSGVMPSDGIGVIPLNQAGTTDTGTGTAASGNADKPTGKEIEEDTMKEVKKNLEKEIESKGYGDKVKVGLDNEGLEISIQDVVLFNSGDAEIIQGVYPLLLQITGMIQKLDNSIKIVGHTDNIPMYSAKFRSNWDLSAYRAINVMNFMVGKGKLNPNKFSIQAYGEFKPKFDNSTEVGRAKNRRVEIFIVRKYPLATAEEIKEDDKTNETNQENQTNQTNPANEVTQTNEPVNAH